MKHFIALCTLLMMMACEKEAVQVDTKATNSGPEFCRHTGGSYVPNGDFEGAEIYPSCITNIESILLDKVVSYDGSKCIRIAASDSGVYEFSYSRKIVDGCEGTYTVSWNYKIIDPVDDGLSVGILKSYPDVHEQLTFFGDSGVWNAGSFQYSKNATYEDNSCILFSVIAGSLLIDNITVKEH